MKLDDYFLALTVGLINAGRDLSRSDVDAIEEAVGTGFALRRPRSPGAYSVGALAGGKELGLLEWTAGLRTAGARARVVELDPKLPGDLPLLQAQGFAGTPKWALAVGTPQAEAFFALASFTSPQYTLRPAELAELIELQPAREAVSARLLREINQSNALNGRPPVAASELSTYLRDGAPGFDLFASDWITAAERAAAGAGTGLAIPAHLADRFTVGDPKLGLPGEDEHSLRVAGDPLSTAELLAFVGAQPDAEAIWARDELQWMFARDTQVPPREIERRLREASDEELARMPQGNLVAAVEGAARDAGRSVQIPPKLKGRIETREAAERRLLGAEYVPPPKRLHLAMTPPERQWSFSCFAPMEGGTQRAPIQDGSRAVEVYARALEATASYARRIESPFAEAFALAGFFLRADDRGPGPLTLASPVDIAAWQARIGELGFSEQARDVIGRHLPICNDLGFFKWSETTLRRLLACDIGDVFGAMGSWNDQLFDEEGARLSNELLRALRDCFAGTLNGSGDASRRG